MHVLARTAEWVEDGHAVVDAEASDVSLSHHVDVVAGASSLSGTHGKIHILVN